MFDDAADASVRIPITRPVFGAQERAAVLRPLETGWVAQGPYVEEFEDRFAAFTGARYAVATTSCTTALHIAVAVLGLAPGDEVIVPAFTWVSTANVVEYMGATPVFCDVRLDTYNIDSERIEDLVTDRTVGIIPVHLFGLCAAMGPIGKICAEHDLWAVEDAACALGSRQGGTHAGTMSDIGCFSFHPRKSITTGEGGMLVTARRDIAELARTLRDHGASHSDRERHGATGSFRLADYEHLGFNYRMTDIQGALGCAQMDRADSILAERARIAELYGERLRHLDWLACPLAPAGQEHGWQAYVCLFAPEEPTLRGARALGERRDRLMAALEAAGIATRPGTHAPVAAGYYASRYGLRPQDFPNACIAEQLTLTLPLYPGMSDADVERVAEQLEAAFEGD